MNTQLKTSLLAICITSALSACGGGGGGGALPATTAAKPAVTVSGSVSGFGSVIINGVRYETSAARLVSDDDGQVLVENPTNAQLQSFIGLGEVINLRGGRDDAGGVATTIIVDNELVGTLTSIDDASLTLKIMGQTISVTPTTIIDDSLLADSAVDAPLGSRLLSALLMTPNTTVLEISGHPGATGIEATRIEDAIATGNTTAAGGEAEVKGSVSGLAGTTFMINDLTVDISGLVVTVANGDFVEVKGSFDAGTSTLTATSLELEDGQFDDEGEVEVEGVIQSISEGQLPAGTITVNGFEFEVADISQYSVGMKIEIKAQMQNGAPVVTRIQDETEDSIRIRDQATGPAVGDDIATRLGLTVSVSDRSRLELNDADNPDAATFLAGVQAGSYIEARGFKLNGSIVWTRIEASDDNKERCRLRGPVSATPANPNFTIEGVTVATGGNTVFRGANGALIDSTTFFGQLAEGDVVQATSPSNGDGCGDTANQLDAKEVSFEPLDDVLEDNGDNDGGDDNNDVADNELTGAVSNVTANSFDIDGETITVDNDTMIDNSLIEALGGPELAADQSFGDAGETLTDLLATDGTVYVVTVDRSGASPLATLIEDF